MAAHGLKPQAIAVQATIDQARTAAVSLLQQEPRPEALLASSGLILLGTTEALRETQLRFPEDVALALASMISRPGWWNRPLPSPSRLTIWGSGGDSLVAAADCSTDQAVRRVVLRGVASAWLQRPPVSNPHRSLADHRMTTRPDVVVCLSAAKSGFAIAP